MTDLVVEVAGAQGLDLEPGLLVRAVEATLRARGVERAEMSLALLDDPSIRDLNRRHLGHDRPTDVLSFALWEPGDDEVVGDVYVGLDQARRQAAEAGVGVAEELVRLAVHGTLHVTGMDHPDEADERGGSAMYQLQESLVRRLMSGTG